MNDRPFVPENMFFQGCYNPAYEEQIRKCKDKCFEYNKLNPNDRETNCTFTTAEHPVDPELRKKGVEIAKSVTVGNNVWIGAGSIVLGGVTIGDNTVIGAGSVVTRPIPANVVAVGVPCRVVREISEKDKTSYPFYSDIK